ncbi:MAG: PKD domain-containing protein [Bacteroidetes bacterium]|nr:MAG: PKD domain-containing protein [Bacteroidota bacterium]
MNKLILLLLTFIAFSTVAQPTLVNRYEYWFNQQVDEKQVEDITPVAQASIGLNLSAEGLPDGLNSFSVRFRDTEDFWSATLTRFFVKMPTMQDANGNPQQIVAYAYRLNQSPLSMQSISAAEQINIDELISAANLPDGLNSFSIRFKDNAGNWSSMLTRFFVKMPVVNDSGETRQIVAYEYGFNKGELTYQSVTAATDISIDEIFSVTDLPIGLNSFSVRFKDNTGNWSSVLTRFFVKMPAVDDGVEANELTAFQLWFNDDLEGMEQTSIAPGATYNLVETLSAAELPQGLNKVSIRFRDSKGQWSSVLSRFFVRNPILQTPEANLMLAYEYWLEDTEGNIYDEDGQPGRTYISLDEPVNPMLLDLDMDLRMITQGDYFLMFRFLDTRNTWSTVLSKEVTKGLFPFAVFYTGETIFCGTAAVAFTNASVDADTWHWDFGDGQESAEFEPVHQFSSPGTYSITLTASDLASGIEHSVSAEINIYPVYEFEETHHICENEVFTWQGNEYTTQGTFTAAYQTVHGCDSVYVLNLGVNPAYEFEEEGSICEGGIFSWQGTEYSLPGTYEVFYETVAGCDSIFVLHLEVNPVFDFEEHMAVCEGESVAWQGATYSETGVYFASYQTVAGCDSLYTLHLEIHPAWEFVENQEICAGESFEWFGEDYFTAGIYHHMLETAAGCDSLFVLDLSVFEVDVTVNQLGAELHALADNASFQWINCADDSFIEGATEALFVPDESGGYAVWVTQNNCTALSDCFEVLISDVHMPDAMSGVKIYPNPARMLLHVELTDFISRGTAKVYTVNGLKWKEIAFNEGRNFVISLEGLLPGVYILKLETDDMVRTMRFVKE